MASLITKIWSQIHTKRSYSIMIIGLDNSGKTSILNCLSGLANQTNNNHLNNNNKLSASQRPPSNSSSMGTSRSSHDQQIDNDETRSVSVSSQTTAEWSVSPTVGYNFERIHYKGVSITVLDFSGQNRYRNMWQEFYNCVDAIVFVIDSSDMIRFVVARDELETMLSHSYFKSLTGQQVDSDDKRMTKTISIKNPSSNRTNSTQKQLTISRGKLVQQPLDTNTASSTSYSQIQFGRASRSRTKLPILFLSNKCDLANSVDIDVLTKVLNLNGLNTNQHPWLIQPTSVNPMQGIMEGFDWLLNQLEA